MQTLRHACGLIAILLVLIGISVSQVATGTPPFSSLGGGPFDVVNLGNLNVHFAVPVIHKGGRGMDFTYDLAYDSSIWTPVLSSGTTSWQPASNWGWQGQTEASQGYVVQSTKITSCRWFDGKYWHTTSLITWTTSGYSDPFGVFHYMRVITDNGSDATCGGVSNGTATATDGSGYSISVSGSIPTVTSRSGAVINATTLRTTGSSTRTDANGNQISVSSGTFTDTLGKSVLTASGSGTPTSPLQFGYVPPANESTQARVYVTANYLSYTVKTKFGATTKTGNAIGEYGPTSIPLVDNITLADGTKYSFTYETTPGSCTPNTGDQPSCVTARIASVTLPSGGKINYSYSGGSSGIFNDGSTPALTRVISPNTSCTSNGCWQYSRTLVTGNPGPGSTWTTLVTDPNSNQTLINFAEDGGTNNNFYETQRQSYQGSTSLLLTTVTCFNTTTSGCATATVSSPISAQAVTRQYPNGGLQSKTATTYDPRGLLSEVDQYAYSTGAPATIIRKTIISYANLGNNILDRPQTVTVEDGGNNPKATTTYSYDETATTSTTGTPSHASVSGSRGNVTTIATQASANVTLYRKFTYYDTGNARSTTDLGTSSGGPNVTNYNYSDATSTCGNAFPSSISAPLGLAHSFTWDCFGGVQTSDKDENSQLLSTYYTGTNFNKSADSYFWRPYAVTDQLNNATTVTYPTVTTSESTLAFNNNNSVVDHRTTLDGFGRPIIGQTEQGYGAANYDSVETDYDIMGRPSKTTQQYAGVASALCSGTCPGTSTTYDPLERPDTIQDAGGGQVKYYYNQNDVLQVVSPVPSGEHAKQKQLEYDALGRLTSVCEITTGTGNGPCSQTTPQTPYSGYWTQYTYDVLGDLTGVTQNSQTSTIGSQTRTFTFDMLGRLTSETNPESGTSTYTYDSAGPNACGTVNSAGDLLQRNDANGNYVCYIYDSLHRVTDAGFSGPNANTCKRYRYDNSSGVLGSRPAGVSITNGLGRLIEAETDNCAAPITPITDEWFSYSARGEITDVWESTPNSGGYYHVASQYWANGALNTLGGLPTLPTITYGATDGSGLDGEGRFTKATASPGQNPLVSSVTYNNGAQTTQPIGALTSLMLGSTTSGTGDSDSFSYDLNTGRLTGYTFSMGASPNTKTQTGVLSWNANGSLQQLQITDQINTANSQTCTFGYDELVRITSANCGSVWAQTFGFDPFGNLKKTGSAQFLPTYTGETGAGAPSNQYYQITGGPTGTSNYYDTNGNLKSDLTHSYTWDGDGNMLSVDSSVSMTYDAMDRMAEQTRGSSHTQIVYAPFGMKLALMNGQTLVNAFVKLPGGGTAVYNSTGLAYYRHSDHLGSSRLATTPSRTKYYDIAYAPYGEDYNGSGTQDLAYTDQNQDTVGGGWSSNLYDFLMREYRTAHGRWTSPDPAGGQAVNPASPQTWNRYAYAVNNPLSFIDPLGLRHCAPDDSTQTCYGGQSSDGGGGGGGDNGGGGGGGGFLGDAGAGISGNPFFPTVYVTGSGCTMELHGWPVEGITWWEQVSCLPGRINPTVDGGAGGGGGAPAKNGRNCTVGSASKRQYVAASAEVSAMTAEFFSGLGPGNLTFDPNSATSQVMAQSGPVQEVLNSYYITGQTSGLYTFGLPGLVSAGGNPVAQFVGSFRWSIAPGNGGIDLSLTNTTSFRSLTYDAGPQWQRGNHWYPTPMGNTHQTYNITATCH